MKNYDGRTTDAKRWQNITLATARRAKKSVKPCFKKFRSIVLEENRSQKHYRRTLGLVRNIIPSATSLREVYEFQHSSSLTNCKSWIGPGPAGHNFEKGPPKDHCDQVWF
jgi:hypothetical protein